jgi:hypothetical protein
MLQEHVISATVTTRRDRRTELEKDICYLRSVRVLPRSWRIRLGTPHDAEISPAGMPSTQKRRVQKALAAGKIVSP